MVDLSGRHKSYLQQSNAGILTPFAIFLRVFLCIDIALVDLRFIVLVSVIHHLTDYHVQMLPR